MFKPVKVICLTIVAIMLLGGCGLPEQTIIAPSPTIHLSHTPIPLRPTATIQPLHSDLSRDLIGQNFDSFIEQSYQRLLSRDPELVLELGLSQFYHTPTDQLTDISDAYIKQTQALEADVLDILKNYDRSVLGSEQQLTYDIYSWYLADRVEGHAFMYDDYPINPTVFSIHLDLLQWFTDLRPLTNQQDAQDYIACLSQVDTKLGQLIDGLRLREERGVILPNFLLDYIISQLNVIATSQAKSTPYYQAFENKIHTLNSLRSLEQETLLTSAEVAINDSVLPAYQALVKYLTHLQSIATNDAGVWKFPNGEDYYAYILKHYTSTRMTADEIHALGIQALDRIHAEMRTLFDQLGYPPDENLPQLFNRVAADSGLLSADEVLKGYEEIIATIDRRTSEVFDLRPNIGVIVSGDPIGGYYIPPAVDGSRPGIFYAQNTGYVTKYSMPTLAYHETIPGHHTQLAIAQLLDLPSFRRASDFTAYAEGWALYAEHLAYEMGMYENDPYGNLGQLQAEAYRAARLVVDTGLHSKRWTFSQAFEFMVDNTGMPEFILYSEVSRYISVPGQATAYYIGYTKLLELRQQAMDELKDQFDLKEFHNLILGNGAMPLDILEQVVWQYIHSKLGGG
ncbi:MAG TPA: DUF885 domain-containing protein [Anaerolineales bacterium]|nr:DUF885 domain-containing protein [Anaerolineales bacterium]